MVKVQHRGIALLMASDMIAASRCFRVAAWLNSDFRLLLGWVRGLWIQGRGRRVVVPSPLVSESLTCADTRGASSPKKKDP